MFSGIVESQSPVVKLLRFESVMKLTLARPHEFSDIKVGDSIAVQGVCLTVEESESNVLQFSVGGESLLVTNLGSLEVGQIVHLERSLAFGQRVHGHLVSGHVHGTGEVAKSQAVGETWELSVQVPSSMLSSIWKKSGITIQGVALTVNSIEGNRVSVLLIPETLRRTQLSKLKTGDRVNLEPDYLVQVLVHSSKTRGNDPGLEGWKS